MATINLVSTLLMGAFLLIIAGAISVIRHWERRSPEVEDAGDALADLAGSPITWTVAFIVIALGFGIGAVAFVGGIALPAAGQDAVGLALIAGLVALLGFFLLAGIYSSVRYRGLGSAPAVAIASTVLGLLIIAAIVLNLVFG